MTESTPTKIQSLRLIYRREIPATPLQIWNWQRRPHALDRLLPYPRFLEILRRPVHLCTGSNWTLRVKLLFTYFDLRFVTEAHELGKSYFETIPTSPLHHFRHEHHFIPWKENITLLEDRLEVAISKYPFINSLFHPLLEKLFDTIFARRHQAIYFDMILWSQLPFSSAVHIFSLAAKERDLSRRLKSALEPMPSLEGDPLQLTKTYEGSCVVINALGYRQNKLAQATLNALAKTHARTIICFGPKKEPKWLASLEAYGERIIYIEVKKILKPWMSLPMRFGFYPREWTSEEDLLSAIFQIIHQRLGSGFYRLSHSSSKPLNPLSQYLKNLKSFLQKKWAFFKEKEPRKPFPLLYKAFNSLEEWLAIYSK